MKNTSTLNRNRDFRRLYAKGKSVAGSCIVVYCRKNGLLSNRLGITVGTKVGKAVKRNLVRRRIREAYRVVEDSLKPGYDIVIVARARAPYVSYAEILGALKALMGTLRLLK